MRDYVSVSPNEQCFVATMSTGSPCMLTATSLHVQIYTQKIIKYSHPVPKTTLELTGGKYIVALTVHEQIYCSDSV